jgi:hypothetical protein
MNTDHILVEAWLCLCMLAYGVGVSSFWFSSAVLVISDLKKKNQHVQKVYNLTPVWSFFLNE